MAVLLVAWEVGVAVLDVPRYLLPGPRHVWVAGVDLRATLWVHLFSTASIAVVGVGVAAVGGGVLGVTMAVVPTVRRAVYPLLVAGQAVPMVVIAPLVVAWFGFGPLPKVAVVAIVGAFPVVVSTVDGIEQVDRDSVGLLIGLGANRRELLRHALVPGAVPSFISGLQIAATYAMVSAVVAEWMGATHGLGILLTRSQASFRVDQMLAAVVLIAVVSVALFTAVQLLGRLLTPWNARGSRP